MISTSSTSISRYPMTRVAAPGRSRGLRALIHNVTELAGVSVPQTREWPHLAGVWGLAPTLHNHTEQESTAGNVPTGSRPTSPHLNSHLAVPGGRRQINRGCDGIRTYLGAPQTLTGSKVEMSLKSAKAEDSQSSALTSSASGKVRKTVAWRHHTA